MGLLELVQKHVEMRKVGSEWHGPCPECGHGPGGAAKSDRFSVKADGRWFCRNCGHGDIIAFLRRFENMSCPDAHVAAGKACSSATCPVSDKCRMGNGVAPPRKDLRDAPVAGSTAKSSSSFTPGEAKSPAEIWQERAEEVVASAHEALLSCPEQLAYLAGRGLPLEAVLKYRLGWNAKTIWRSRDSWGLPEEISKKTSKPKKLWAPRGIVIPTYVDGVIHRVRIRVPEEDRNEDVPGYVAVSGSGDDVVILNPAVRAFVVVEADLCGLLIDWVAGDLVGALPLMSCDVKPKSRAAALLDRALVILVATDYEPRQNANTGNYENPGGKAARWWLKNYSRAKRWPVLDGKDPGDALSRGVDIRAWVMAGLPQVITLTSQYQAQDVFAAVPAETTTPYVAAVEFDQSRAVQLISDTYSLISGKCPSGAMDWLGKERPDVFGRLALAEKAVVAALEDQDAVRLSKALDTWKRYHLRAFDIFEARPPVIIVE
ncbi:MAG: hypothetical protein A2Y38_19340 [Spirochaetes bacterium GWB1_59_5]|nr:MAG: hypothetical protein A2Y38_19340 [Spirochaetes bacterium GWB1_59_5]